MCSTGDLAQGSCPQEVAFRHGDPVPISSDHSRNQHGLDNARSMWGSLQPPALAVLGGCGDPTFATVPSPSAGWRCPCLTASNAMVVVQVYDAFSKQKVLTANKFSFPK